MSGWHIRDKSKVTIGAWLHKRTESCVMTTAHGHTRSTEPYSLLLTAKGMYVVRIHIKHCNIYLLFLPPPPPPHPLLLFVVVDLLLFLFFVCLFVTRTASFFSLSFLLLMWNFAGVGSQNVGSWPISGSQRLGELGLVHNELRSSRLTCLLVNECDLTYIRTEREGLCLNYSLR